MYCVSFGFNRGEVSGAVAYCCGVLWHTCWGYEHEGNIAERLFVDTVVVRVLLLSTPAYKHLHILPSSTNLTSNRNTYGQSNHYYIDNY